ncbi:MAG: hypothetical protein KKH52_03945 [Nanoarchaeota archaeon]|nr:hypothetical protein [Nanoarchaeota archaeon]MBU1622952.1 hypothetical protein [Nanoarchaeota archaeon]MBU1974521.1 hypothetical protein [Nanoarchaeota archaeon]
MVHVGKECLTKAYQLSTEGKLEEAKKVIKDMLDDEREEGQKLNEVVYKLKEYQNKLHELLNIDNEKDFQYHIAVAEDLLQKALEMMGNLLEEMEKEE